MKKEFQKVLRGVVLIFSLVLIFIGITDNTFAAISTQNQGHYYVENDYSAFGKFSGPRYIETPTGDYSSYVITDYNPVTTQSVVGSYRNDATVTSLVGVNTSQGITYTGMSPDYFGLEDVNWRFNICTANNLCWPAYVTSNSSDTFVEPFNDSARVGGMFGVNGTTKPGFRITTANQSYSYVATGGTHAGPFTRTQVRSCAPKYVCTDARTLEYRDSDCNYHASANCTDICINGTCDPSPTPAQNVTTQPMTPPDVPFVTAPQFTSAQGLLQCKVFERIKSTGNIEYYNIPDAVYHANVLMNPSTAKLLSWTALDSAFSTSDNQRPIYGYHLDDTWNYGSRWNSSTNILSLDLYPNFYGGLMFRSKSELQGYVPSPGNVSYFSMFRGDSYVLQLQSYYWDGKISPPSYYHYTLPTYDQCAPPNEITSITVQKQNMSCADTSNLISWTAVPGADQYQIVVTNNANPSWMPAGMGPGDLIATTNSTSYTYTPVSPAVNATYKVKIYAHNSKGWNISNSTTQFTTNGNCNCTGPDGATIANGASATYYSAQSGSCPSISRTCVNSVLSGSNTYQYATCSHNCLAPDGTTMTGGQSRVFYDSSTSNTTCNSINRVCNASTGVLSGDPSYTYNTCTSTACIGPGGHSIPVGTGRTYYRSTVGTVVAPCESENRICSVSTPHTLSGTFTEDYCNMTGNSCTGPGGITIPDGSAYTYYSYSTDINNVPCDSQTRWCTDGVLGGDPNYAYLKCPMGNSCSVAVGGNTVSMEDGETKRFYFITPSPCDDGYDDVTCNDGTLENSTGTYQTTTCTNDCTVNGVGITNGSYHDFYSTNSGSCSISRARFYCTNGVVSGGTPTDYPYGTCVERDCLSGGVIVQTENEVKHYSKLTAPPPCSTWDRTCVFNNTNQSSSLIDSNQTVVACGNQSGNITIGTYTASPEIVNPGGYSTITVQVTGAKHGCEVTGENINSLGGDHDTWTVFTDTTPLDQQDDVYTMTTRSLSKSSKFVLYCRDEDDVGKTQTIPVTINPFVKER